MELNALLPVLRRWLIVMIAATGVAILVGYLLSSSADKTYESESVILVGPLNTDNETMKAASSLAQTYAELATSDSLLGRVADTTGLPEQEVTDGVRATANGTTRFLTIRARAADATSARNVANAVTEDLIALSQGGAVRAEGQLRVIDPATVPSTPVSPRGDLVVPLAAIAGLLGSAAMVLVFEFVSDSAESAAKVSEAAGVTTLTVPRRGTRLTRLGRRRRPDPLRVIATQVELSAPAMRCVVVTGASDDDGTQEVALELAGIWAERRAEITIIDATGDILHLWGEDPLPDALPSASVTDATAEGVIAELAADGQLIVVVAPSPVTSTATLVWAHVADVTLLGVRRFQARRALVRDAASNLRATDANVAFALLHDGGRRAPASATTVEPEPRDDDSSSVASDGERAPATKGGRPDRVPAAKAAPR